VIFQGSNSITTTAVVVVVAVIITIIIIIINETHITDIKHLIYAAASYYGKSHQTWENDKK
jgi:hypothetical protein